MRTVGNLTLRIGRDPEHIPQRVSVAVAGAAVDDEGFVHITPDCITLDDLEGCINLLQDELDVLRPMLDEPLP